MNPDLRKSIENILSNHYPDENEMLFHLKNVVYENEILKSYVKDSTNISKLISKTLEVIKNGTKGENEIQTGFDAFDKQFGGFSLGELVVIGGRPAMGKTQLLVNLALNIASAVPVVYFTFDLPETLLMARFISSISNIAANKILQLDLTGDEKDFLLSLDLSKLNNRIFINDSCNNSLSAFKDQCEKQVKVNGVKVIIVDYLQMMASFKHRNNREFEISYVTRELKNFARNHNVCVIVSSQLSRSVEYRENPRHPQLSDLRESGTIEQYADKVIFIYRPEYYGIKIDIDGNNIVGLTEIIMAKNRNGGVGTVKMQRTANFTSFKEFQGYSNEFNFSKSRLKEIGRPFEDDPPF